MNEIIEFEDFTKVEIASGTIISASINEKAKKPAYILDIDFGEKYGIKRSSAQICKNYSSESLIDTQIIAVMNFKPLRVAGIKSEVLVLAIVCESNGTVLVRPDKKVNNGERLL
jgi:tRNA-binding protein